MKQDKQKAAIALALGVVPLMDHRFEDRDERRYFECEQCGLTQGWLDYQKNKGHTKGPCVNTKEDYLEDLNASMRMQEAAVLLDNWDDEYYVKTLCGMTEGFIHRATASQRAEAFLRTIGKWTE